MPLFRKMTDEEQFEKWDKEAEALRKKNYDLLPSQKNYPNKSYLLTPNKILATSIDRLNAKEIRINIGYKSTYSGYVTETIRMNYDRIIKGSLLCSELKSIEEIPYTKKSDIKTSIFSSYKEIIVPVQLEKTFSIKCKCIFIEAIDIYAFHQDNLILDDAYRLILKDQLKN